MLLRLQRTGRIPYFHNVSLIGTQINQDGLKPATLMCKSLDYFQIKCNQKDCHSIYHMRFEMDAPKAMSVFSIKYIRNALVFLTLFLNSQHKP